MQRMGDVEYFRASGYLSHSSILITSSLPRSPHANGQAPSS